MAPSMWGGARTAAGLSCEPLFEAMRNFINVICNRVWERHAVEHVNVKL